MSEVELKIVKQIEYYFGDLNLVKDKHLKDLIDKSNDGWVLYDDLLKFPRLKQLSEDKETIKLAVQNSSSSIVEANDEGIRRNSSLPMPENLREISEKHMETSVYVKGFSKDENIDSIIEYLEKFGGPTLNVHMRRVPKDKSFKGSVFAVFKTVDGAEKFLSNEESASFNNNEMIRMWQKDYFNSKKNEQEDRLKEKDLRQKEALAAKEALLQSRMTKGALLELSFKKKADLESDIKGEFCEVQDSKIPTKNLKAWLTQQLTDITEVSWVEYMSVSGKIIVRMSKENSAEVALKKILDSEHCVPNENKFVYQCYEFTGAVLTGDEEKDYWRNVLSEQSLKRKKQDRFGGPSKKRMRR